MSLIGELITKAEPFIMGGMEKITPSEAKKATSAVKSADAPTTRDLIDLKKSHSLQDLRGTTRKDFATALTDINSEIETTKTEANKLKIRPDSSSDVAIANLDKRVDALQFRKAELEQYHGKAKTWTDFAGENAGTILGGTAMTAMTVLPMAPMLMSAPGAGAPAISPPTTSTLA